MNSNEIIDDDLTNNQLLSTRALDIMKVSGVFALILAIVSMVQILIGLGSMTQQLMSLFQFSDMGGGYQFYILTGLLNKMVNTLLNFFAVVFLFRYGMFAMKDNKDSFGEMEWDVIFKTIRNLFIIFALENISWFLFSVLNLLIGLVI